VLKVGEEGIMIEAFIDCHPPTATAQHKSTRVFLHKESKKPKLVMFETGKVKDAREALRAHFERFSPETVLIGPLVFTCVWTFYWSDKDEARRKRGEITEDWVPKITTPDGDNLAKMMKDVLQELGYCSNDSHISKETYERGHGDRPGIHFKLGPYLRQDWYRPPEGPVPPPEVFR
jgi:Holliday junction resolvase RusA-like endonuclease